MTDAPSSRQWIICGFVVLLSLPCGAQVYVSPKGDDANPGTPRRPIQTLEKAISVARNEWSEGGKDVVVTLAGGTYRLKRPVRIDASDSGRNGNNLVFTAATGEHPVLNGAVQITGWKVVDKAKDLWAAPWPPGLTDSRQLYIDGARATRTRRRCTATASCAWAAASCAWARR